MIRRRTLALALVSLLLAAVPACKDNPDESDPSPSSVPFSIETRASAPPPDDLVRSTRTVEITEGESAALTFVALRPPTDPEAPAATLEDTVTIRFAAGLDRGAGGVEIYDSTEARKRDFSFSLSNPDLPRGFVHTIEGMRPGEIRRAQIPWRLGYGENGRGEIPPSTDLVFAVELVSID